MLRSKNYHVGQVLNALSARLEEEVTKPPDRYNQSTLLDDMLAAWKFAASDEDRDLLKEVAGIGTSRTRGVIIKSFIDRGFLLSVKKGKVYELRIAPEGRALLDGLPEPLKDVALTAKWERALAMVADGSAKPEQLHAKVDAILRAMVTQLLNKPSAGAPVAPVGTLARA